MVVITLFSAINQPFPLVVISRISLEHSQAQITTPSPSRSGYYSLIIGTQLLGFTSNSIAKSILPLFTLITIMEQLESNSAEPIPQITSFLFKERFYSLLQQGNHIPLLFIPTSTPFGPTHLVSITTGALKVHYSLSFPATQTVPPALVHQQTSALPAPSQ